MSGTNDGYYFLAGVNDIPWNRIVHWYGRATGFPELLAELRAADLTKQEYAINKILVNIEHQDGIIMATPFTLIFLFRSLSLAGVNKLGILKAILKVLKAAKFQDGFYGAESANPEVKPADPEINSIQDLITEKYLWPEFESEEQDELNWEEYNYAEEYCYWIKYTLDIAKSFIGVWSVNYNDEEEEVAKQILQLMK